MKWLFLVALGLLVTASVMTQRSLPRSRSPVPVIYWVSDANLARAQQIDLFHRWMLRNGHTVDVVLNDIAEAERFRADLPLRLADDVLVVQPELADLMAGLFKVNSDGTLPDLPADFLEQHPQVKAALTQGFDPGRLQWPIRLKLPACEMRLDSATGDVSKRIIQGVSGVAGEIWDTFSGAALRPLVEIGLARDVTEPALRLGYDVSKTYPALLPELTVPDEHGQLRQYMFPCNVNTDLLIANLETFERHGLPPPPAKWTVEEFERHGLAFVKAANPPGTRIRAFFSGSLQIDPLRYSAGGTTFDETLSAPRLASEPNRRVLALKYKWTYVDRLLPSAADLAATTAESGFGGIEPQLLNSGLYAMIQSGRWRIISFRDFNIARTRTGQPPLRLSVSELPYYEMRCNNIGTRAAIVYRGAKHGDLALLFQAYLASPEYNQQIVDDGDALPPLPQYTRGEDFLRPRPDPAKGIYAETEHAFHEPFATVGPELGVGGEYSPFINHARANQEINALVQGIMGNVRSVDDALQLADRRIEQEIQRNLRENPRLLPRYQQLRERQRTIDAMLAAIRAHLAGQPGLALPDELKLPAQWIDNPVLQRYYREKGWLKPS